MVEAIDPEDLSSQTASTYNVLGQPVSSGSLFYALYWLDEVRNETEAAFDFTQLRNDLWDGFQVYGLYSVVRELGVAFDHFWIDGEVMSSYHDRGAFREAETRITEQVSSGDSEYLASLVIDSAPLKREKQFRADGEAMFNLLMTAEEQWSAISEPDRFLSAAEDIFSKPPQGGLRPEFGWQDQYGGDAWGAICRHLLRAGDLPKTVWINQSWAIQHNNTIWLNKLQIPRQERSDVSEVFHRIYPGNHLVGTLSNEEIFDTALRRLLDERKKGNMEPVFAYAWEFTDELEINLRRLSQRHGIDRGALTEWINPVVLALTDTQAEMLRHTLSLFRGIRDRLPGQMYREWIEDLDPATTESEREVTLEDVQRRLEALLEADEVQIEFSVSDARALLDALNDMRSLLHHPNSDPYRAEVGLRADPQTTRILRSVSEDLAERT